MATRDSGSGQVQSTKLDSTISQPMLTVKDKAKTRRRAKGE